MTKNIKWVDINEPANKKYTFTPLNESEETPAFECRTNTIVKDVLKSQILAATIYDATMKLMESNHKPMVMESNDGISFMQTQDWASFKGQARLIAQLMTQDQKKVDELISNLETAFKNLSGEEDVEKGFDRFNELRAMIIGPESPIYGIKPQPQMNEIISLLLPQTYKVGRGRGTSIKEKVYDINVFIDMVVNKKSQPSLLPIFNSINDTGRSTVTFNNVIEEVFKRRGKGYREKISDIFLKIIGSMNGYKKNGGTIGKGEIALALFFKDCQLARNKGDLEIIGSDTNIEIKGEGGAITQRLPKTFPLDMFPGSSDVMFKITDPAPEAYSDKNVIKTLNLNNIDLSSSKYTDELKQIFAKIDMVGNEHGTGAKKRKLTEKRGVGADIDDTNSDNLENDKNQTTTRKRGRGSPVDISNNTWKDLLKFKILFSAAFMAYHIEAGWNAIVGINTKNSDRAFDLTSDSPTMNTPLIKLTISNESNWYRSGCRVLDYIMKNNAKVKLEDMMNENNVFKIYFH